MRELIIDDVDSGTSRLGRAWRLVGDTVMGGVSRGTLTQETVAGRAARRMRGSVSLENNGGFLQMALDLAPDGEVFDASGMAGLGLTVCGNGEDYNVHLRTRDLDRPWQSFRARFHAGPEWRQVTLPFSAFTAHRTEAPLRLERLHRIGLVAIGRAFEADLAIARLVFFCADDAA
ncbi:MAG: Complex I intermediate-associated protein 30 (CIA30) [Saliniramus fredricksonii]|uniref:Complex I intermediate-associated protein 30 (CIA30) n=1 Tax=Saliniramus fredricksonii TaxID=1653334 RepID=A0A0P8A3A0_9HYPH|nr:CIA30 family protein [Saliniramus fredricksonii]KPQ09710.1 MAG: Complex I intermediate-associated protein 30 (CIA30) [Saliniramus fredricksonii]SCC79855.1 Complex I intermediate-associated protein 30 (CIA30) [Saliniramus fredricksonii]